MFSSDKDVMCVDDEQKPQGTWMRSKLLQFHTNYRPPYYGTWRKQSKLIRPRNPLNQDKVPTLSCLQEQWSSAFFCIGLCTTNFGFVINLVFVVCIIAF